MGKVSSSVGAFLVAAAVATSCGVLADDNAATVGDAEITVSTVEALVADDSLAQLINIGGDAAPDESVISGAGARSALDFAIQVEVIVQQAEELGAEITTDDSELRLQVGEQAAVVDELDPESKDALARFVNASSFLTTSQALPAPASEDDALLIYDAVAEEFWAERVCIDLVTAQGAPVADVADALEGGADLDEIEASQGPDGIVEALQVCDAAQISQFPAELVAAIESAEFARRVGPVELSVDNGTGQVVDISVWFVRNSAAVDRDEATAEIEPLLADPTSALVVSTVRNTWVNPRFGSGIEVTIQQGQTGPVLVAAVAAPESPAPAGA